jgi:hypothetical protein
MVVKIGKCGINKLKTKKPFPKMNTWRSWCVNYSLPSCKLNVNNSNLKYLIPIIFLLYSWHTADAQITSTPTSEFVKLGRGKVAVKQFHDNGQISQTGWFKYNVPHGPWASFDENGHISAQAQYERGYKHGQWRFWDAKGNLVCEITYHFGTIITAKQYDVKGTVIAALEP